MKLLKTVRKEKFKKVLKLDSLNSLNFLNIKKHIPDNAQKLEFVYKEETGLLCIDYITILDVKTNKG